MKTQSIPIIESLQIFGAIGVLAVTTALAAVPPTPTAAPTSASTVPSRAERGRYLVHQSGMCIDCHSPRDEKGGFVEAKHLTGAPIGFKPLMEMPWMPAAPALAGLPAGFNEEAMVHFLMTGERPNGKPVLPPMPAYRFNREDAEAITLYLHGLAGPNK